MKRILDLIIAYTLFQWSTFPLVFWFLSVLLNTSASHVVETAPRQLLKQPRNSSHDLEILRSYHAESVTPRFIVIGAQVS
jgi:hypothetical protein